MVSAVARKSNKKLNNCCESHRGWVVISPLSSSTDFPTYEEFSMGNLLLTEDRRTSYPAIDRGFQKIKDQLGFQTEKYSFYGHSAGAQFVHRFVLFNPESLRKAAALANAG